MDNIIRFIEAIKSIFPYWKWTKGLLSVIGLEWLFIFCCLGQQLKPIMIVGICLIVLIVTFIVWVIYTDRWFHRTKYRVLLWLSLIFAASTLFAYCIYPTFLESSNYGSEYIRWIGSVLTFMICFFIYYCLDFLNNKHKDLYIVFLVSNSSKNEEKILSTLDMARHQIEKACKEINIIIPPFGIADSIKSCERFINGWFCQADAVIYAKMIESDDEFGYKFTDFTSRMNRHRMKRKNEECIDVNFVLTEASKCNDWNTLNIIQNSIEKKEFIASNLSQLLLIYVGCIYMYKKRYSEAIPVVNQLFNYSNGNLALQAITRDVIAEAYLIAEQWEEQEVRDYEMAKNTLMECKERLPYITSVLRYKLSMARICMLQGDIKESKKYTKSITPPRTINGVACDRNIFDWYKYVNLAFYAIYERKPREIISNYKKLFKSPLPDAYEVNFSINYLLNEINHTKDSQYSMYLYHGIAFLYLYLDMNNAKKYLKKAEKYRNVDGYEQISELRDIIENQKCKLILRK